MLTVNLKTGTMLVNTAAMLSAVITKDSEYAYRYSAVVNMCAGLSHKVTWENAATPFDATMFALSLSNRLDDIAIQKTIGDLMADDKSGVVKAMTALIDGGLAIDEDDFKELYK